MTLDSLCNELQFAKCCSAEKYLLFLDKQEKGHDVSCLRGELMYMSMAIRSLESFIPIGTLISDPGSDACGWSGTVIGFAPIDESLPVFINTIAVLLNGSPIPFGVGPFNGDTVEEALILALNDLMNALSSATGGAQWHYVQISEFQFYICSEYTLNGTEVRVTYEVGQEAVLGNITMGTTLSGGVAPAESVYQEDDQCLTQLQAQSILGKLSGMCSCDEESTEPEANIELREDLNLELRENGN